MTNGAGFVRVRSVRLDDGRELAREHPPMIPPIADRFVAGEQPSDPLDHAATINDDDLSAIINRLGEHYDRPRSTRDDRDTYLELIESIDSRGLSAVVSVKPTQFGLGIEEDLFRENLRAVVKAADRTDGFVWMDMEDHTTTEATLDAYEAVSTAYGGRVGVCVQSNLRRTRGDLDRLADSPGKVRLVKGAYDEPAEVAYTTRQEVNERYRGDLEFAFRRFDDGVAVATHDPAMIDHALNLHDDYGTPFEFQMLMGVREDEQRRLASDGYQVWQYVPYGPAWASYFWRRIRERKENLLFALRAVFG